MHQEAPLVPSNDVLSVPSPSQADDGDTALQPLSRGLHGHCVLLCLSLIIVKHQVSFTWFAFLTVTISKVWVVSMSRQTVAGSSEFGRK